MKRTKCLQEILVYNLIIKMIGVYLDGVEGCKCRPPVLEIWRHHWPRHHHRHHHHHHKQHFHDYHHHQEYWSQFADPGCSGWPGFHWNRSLHLLQTHHCTAHSIGKYPRNLNFDERRSEPFFWQYLKKGRNHAAAIVNFNEYSLFCFKWEIGKILSMTNDWWKRHRMRRHGGESLKVCTATTLSSSDWHEKSRPACQQQALHSKTLYYTAWYLDAGQTGQSYFDCGGCVTLFVLYVLWASCAKSKRFALGQA